MDAVSTFAITLFFIVIYRITKKWLQNEVKASSFLCIVYFTNWKLIEGYLFLEQFTLYELMMAGVESSLGFILTLIFLQSLPLLSISKRRQSLKTEEIVCLIILLASVMTGTIGWSIYDFPLNIFCQDISSYYLPLLVGPQLVQR